jgi:hypothetical protein
METASAPINAQLVPEMRCRSRFLYFPENIEQDWAHRQKRIPASDAETMKCKRAEPDWCVFPKQRTNLVIDG